MKIKTSELRGPALDWAVEMVECEGAMYSRRECRPFSTDWAQGGPIIERERIQLRDHIDLRLHWTASLHVMNSNWAGKMVSSTVFEDGPTLLVAAMRCYVASKLGDEVEVSDELTQGEAA